MLTKNKTGLIGSPAGDTVVLEPCPKYPARKRKYFVYEFLTPHSKELLALARELMEQNGWKDDPLKVFFDFISTKITYVGDDEMHNTPEWWQMPFETINSEWLKGDCEDVAYALASLLLATQYIPEFGRKKLNVYADNTVRVPLGAVNGGGHAWVEVLTNHFSGEWEWYMVEPTSNSPLTLGNNALTVENSIRVGYQPEFLVYDTRCEQVVRNKGAYNRPHQPPLIYGVPRGRCSTALRRNIRRACSFALEVIS